MKYEVFDLGQVSGKQLKNRHQYPVTAIYTASPETGMDGYFLSTIVTERPHQSLEYATPIQVYRTAIGGGARIVDKFAERKTTLKNGAAPGSC